MAILSRDDYMSTVKSIVGEKSDDESIRLLEDLTDTYNDLERRSQGDGEDWEQRYKDLDEQWRKRYTQRFYDSDGGNPYEGGESRTEPEEKEVTIEGLFTEEK